MFRNRDVALALRRFLSSSCLHIHNKSTHSYHRAVVFTFLGPYLCPFIFSVPTNWVIMMIMMMMMMIHPSIHARLHAPMLMHTHFARWSYISNNNMSCIGSASAVDFYTDYCTTSDIAGHIQTDSDDIQRPSHSHSSVLNDLIRATYHIGHSLPCNSVAAPSIWSLYLLTFVYVKAFLLLSDI